MYSHSTDFPQEGKVSVRDDPDQRIFTVTINNLTAEDSDRYWCGVKRSGASDVGDRVNLSVTDGPPGLSVDKQEVMRVEGGSVSVQCRYGNNNKPKTWCKIGGSCASEKSGGLDGRPVLIRDDTENKVFSVTMSGLERKDTGWYWCAAGNLQIPVHITVKQGGDNEKLRWEQVLDAVLKAGTGVFYLICTIIAIQLHWTSCKKREPIREKQKVSLNQRKLAEEMTFIEQNESEEL
ncbi:polymeric immunoglobulin receptor-like isoform X12 [Brienomyrus brachyistius]|uniref:polymeric immunoglobulin receptor-like isoform X12 n=1 Tax=Brienomyrus brachyistius TaxID=42636 RepID=UPI0020B44569|nr:polymeric immunoglobulin receptor-like isoform X12 [Brienomyrus brachyistius]